jgi:pyruvate/2-oxoglutarate dehydrogenase complex dihydrolipoamide acyltransferase (E2) component
MHVQDTHTHDECTKHTHTAAAPVAAPLVRSGERVVASPLAKKMAAEKGIDLATVAGTGPSGRVIARYARVFLLYILDENTIRPYMCVCVYVCVRAHM